jgi:hypothetical protein
MPCTGICHLANIVALLANSGRLWDQVSPKRIIWFWWGANRIEEARAFLSRSMGDPATLVKVLDLVIQTTVSTGGNYERVGYGYEKLIEIDDLKAAATDLEKHPPDDQSAAAAKRFLQALANREQRPSG